MKMEVAVRKCTKTKSNELKEVCKACRSWMLFVSWFNFSLIAKTLNLMRLSAERTASDERRWCPAQSLFIFGLLWFLISCGIVVRVFLCVVATHLSPLWLNTNYSSRTMQCIIRYRVFNVLLKDEFLRTSSILMRLKIHVHWFYHLKSV